MNYGWSESKSIYIYIYIYIYIMPYMCPTEDYIDAHNFYLITI